MDGVEAHLQELLADHVETFGLGWRLVRREYPTPIGPVDLLCRDDTGVTVAVEVKHRGRLMDEALLRASRSWTTMKVDGRYSRRRMATDVG